MASAVERMSNTRIFVGLNKAFAVPRQATVYAMSVELQGKTSNAMILSVPLGKHGTTMIDLVDLSDIPDFFTYLAAPFKQVSRGMKGAIDKVKVEKVGNYDVSIISSIDDLHRLDSTFTLSPMTASVLRKHYANGFAFIVARIARSGPFHPLAYTSPVVDGRLVIPTRHEHGDGGASLPEWDHTIYHQGNKAPAWGYVPPARAQVETRTQHAKGALLDMRRLLGASKAVTLSDYIDHDRALSRFTAYGELPNVDLSLSL